MQKRDTLVAIPTGTGPIALLSPADADDSRYDLRRIAAYRIDERAPPEFSMPGGIVTSAAFVGDQSWLSAGCQRRAFEPRFQD